MSERGGCRRLDGRAAIITGAGGGIGREIAIEFAREGASVTVLDIDQAGAAETVRLVEEDVGAERALALGKDIGTEAGVREAVAATVARFGRLDCVVHNAADQTARPLEEVTDEHWRRVQAVNVEALVRFARAALPHLTAHPGGSLVAVSSLVGEMALPGLFAYNVSKTALLGVVRALAVELGPRGVRANAIVPGHIMSEGEERWKAGRSEREQKVMASSYALCRVGRPEEVARVAVFLASDDASFITGESLRVDGGMGILCPEESVLRAAAL